MTLSIGTVSNVSVEQNGAVSIGTVRIALQDNTYHRLYRRDNVAGMLMGGTADPGTYYDNTDHWFRNAGGSFYVQISNGFVAPAAASGSTLGTPAQPWNGLYTTSGISVGAGGTRIPAISSISSRIAAFVVQPSASSFTRVIWAAAQPGDQILVTVQPDAAVSSLSSGLVMHSHCTQAGQVEFRLSNVSTLAQNQSQKTYYFTRVSPF